MGFFTTHIMLVTRQVDFSIKLKQALEKVGQYVVTPFTSPANALDYLQANHQDVVLVDALALDIEVEAFVNRLHDIQPGIGILLGPDNADVRWQAQTLDLHVIAIPCTVRMLLPHLQALEQQQYEQVQDTTHPQPLENQPDTSVIQSPPIEKVAQPEPIPPDDEAHALEFVVSEDGNQLLQVTQGSQAQPELRDESDKAIEIFQRLAAEEPPMPTFEESGTVHDLVSSVNSSNVRKVIQLFSEAGADGDTDEEAVPDDDEEQPIPAVLILESATDDSTPLEAFSLSDFLKRIEHPGIQPLPSWVQESERFVREPDFLPEQLQGFSQPLEYTSAVTQGGGETIEGQPENLPTDLIAPKVRSRPATPQDFSPPSALPEEDTLTSVQSPASDHNNTQSQPPPPPDFLPEETTDSTIGELPLAVPDSSSEIFLLSDEPGDPRMAQIALTLTQVSLELTAEATLLAKDGQVVAYAGSMADDDLEDIRQVIADDWETIPEQSRIRFINLPSNGADYMLYSRRTDDGFTLSMVFAGTMPLRVIRRQSKRLSDALAAVPEIIIEADEDQIEDEEVELAVEPPSLIPVVAAPPPDLAYTSMTAVWLLQDADQPLTSIIAQTLADELHKQLTTAFWRIYGLQVHPDYVYLQAEFPGESPTNEIMHDLLKLSAAIVVRDGGTANPNALWADSYLVVTPGREMANEEIQEFIQFVRM